MITPFKNFCIADRIEEEGYDSASSSVINEFIKKGRCIETKPREPYPNEKEWKFEPKVMPQTTFTVSGKPGSSVKSNGLNNSLTEQFMEIYSRKDISFSEKEKLADELKEREKGISHNYR